MVLGQSVEVGVVWEQLVDVCPLFVVVVCVRRAVAPTARVIVAGFQTALFCRFPFVLGFDLDTLVLAKAALLLVGGVVQVGQ